MNAHLEEATIEEITYVGPVAGIAGCQKKNAELAKSSRLV
jgi:hypothetical protein